MPKFSERSQGKLDGCHAQLRWLFGEAVKEYDCTVVTGPRGEEEQDEAFHSGASKVMYPNSKHNSEPSMAADVAPYPIDWNDTKRFYHFAGYVKGLAQMAGIEIRWGGDWDSDLDFNDQTFMDLIHFEVIE